jgi:hypothetical protein
MQFAVLNQDAQGETRVALVPDSIKLLLKQKHSVLVQCGAGAAASIPDALFEGAGARMAARAERGQRGVKWYWHILQRLDLSIRSHITIPLTGLFSGTAVRKMESEKFLVLYFKKFCLEGSPLDSKIPR